MEAQQKKELIKILDSFIEEPNIDKFRTEVGKNFTDDYKNIKEVAYFTVNYLTEKKEVNHVLQKTILDTLNKTPDDENCYPCLHAVLEYVVQRPTVSKTRKTNGTSN